MKQLILIALFSFSITSFSQSKGDEFREKGKLLMAIKAYKKAFTEDNSNAQNTYSLACTFALTYQKDSAFYYLKVALKNDNRLWVLADNDLFPLTKDDRWKTIEKQQLEKYQAKNGQLKKPNYSKQLLRIIMKDQVLDYQQDMARNYYMKNGHVPHWFYPILDLKKKISDKNFSKMEQLVNDHGWPTYASVGKLAADAPLLVINHLEGEEVRMKYLPQIKNACLKKEGSCMEYAKINDRILVNTNKLQTYGMQFRYNAKRELEPFPIKDPEYVDQKRLAIGLEPIKEYLKRKINYNWTTPQKTK
jgi:hypothetical protein